MKVSTLIETLQHFSPEEEILVAWWEKSLVEEWFRFRSYNNNTNNTIMDEDWSDIVDAVINNDYCWEQCDLVIMEETKRILEENNND